MITHTEEIKEYREDGSLQYECTFAFIAKGYEHLYCYFGWKGEQQKARIGHATKYNKDGSINWRFNYDEFGNIISVER